MYTHALILNEQFQLTVYLFSDDRPDHKDEANVPLINGLNPFITQLGKLFNIEYQPERMEVLFQWDIQVKDLYPPLQPVQQVFHPANPDIDEHFPETNIHGDDNWPTDPHQFTFIKRMV